MKNELTHIDLFSGIGGFAIAANACGFRTVAFCEKEPYAQQILKEKFGAEIVADAGSDQFGQAMHTGESAAKPRVGAETLADADKRGIRRARTSRHTGHIAQPHQGGPALHPDIFTLNGTTYRGATLLTGGFPCQPFSVAGKRRGAADDRALWPEMCRVISECQPAWIIGENVAGIITMELDRVLSDLEAIGYTAWPIVIPACAVDARHRRDRVWIVAHADKERESRLPVRTRTEHASIRVCGENVALADEPGPQGRNRSKLRECAEQRIARAGDSQQDCTDAGQFKSAVLRMVDGLPERLDDCGLAKEKERHIVMGYGTPKTTRRKEELPALRKANGAETIPEQSGGSGLLPTAQVLRPALHGEILHQGEGDAGRTSQASGEVPRDAVRRVQDDEESCGASSGRESGEQHAYKSDDAVRFVSHEMALEERQAYCQWPEEDSGTPRVTTRIPHRSHRLRGLGNAIVPQVAIEIIRGIAEIERAN